MSAFCFSYMPINNISAVNMIKTKEILPSISRMFITVIGAISLYYANKDNDSFLIGALMPMIAFGYAVLFCFGTLSIVSILME